MNDPTRKHPAHLPTRLRGRAFFVWVALLALLSTPVPTKADWQAQLGTMAAPPTTVPAGVCADPPRRLPPAAAPPFRWVSPLPQGDNLLSVWGSGPEDVWAVGDAGRVVHFDGTAWKLVHTGVTDYLAGVWGSDKKDVWVTGYNGRVLRYDGSAWWDHPTGVSNDFNGIWGSGPDDVFTVGDRGVIFHWDGNCFRRQETGTDNLFFGVWGSSGKDVWAVGGRGNIARFDGKAWHPVDTGLANQRMGHFVSVWGTGRDDVYVAGILPAPDAEHPDAHHNLLHFNGTAWQPVATGVNGLLRWIWGTGKNDIWVAGEEGVLIRFDGAAWTVLPVTDRLTRRGGWSDPAGGAAWVVGDDGLIAVPGKPAPARPPGTAIPRPAPEGLPGPTPLPTGETLSAVSAGGVGVGRGGGIFRWDGNRWQTLQTGGFSLFAVADDPARPGRAWAVGDFGRIVRIDGNAVTAFAVTGQPLYQVEARPDGSVTVRGEGGVVLERPGTGR